MRPRKRAKKAAATPERRLIATTDTGEVGVTVPAGGRVSFGPDLPYVTNTHSSEKSYCLRIYRDKTNASLCAVVPRVFAFRDADVAVDRVAMEKTSKSGATFRMVAEYGATSNSVPLRYGLYMKAGNNWRGPIRFVETEEEAAEVLAETCAADARIKTAAGHTTSF